MIEAPDISTALQARIEKTEAMARNWRRLFPKSMDMRLAQRSYDEDFIVRMAFNSNAIEGSTLTLPETEIIYEGEFVPGKPGAEQVAARGIFEGSAFMGEKLAHGASLDEALLRDLHERCALDLQPAARGMYRNAPAIIRASRTVPTAPAKIRDEVASLFFLSNGLEGQMHSLVRIPWFHAALEDIHPFADGNGRTGRLWLNAQLEKEAYPPICIKADRSAEYKEGLEAWQADGNPEPFIGLFFDSLEAELERRIDFLSQAPEEVGFAKTLADRSLEAMGVIYGQPSVSARSLGGILGVSERQAQRILRELQAEGLVSRKGAPKNGAWLLAE